MRARHHARLDRLDAALAVPIPTASSASCPDCMAQPGEPVRFIFRDEHPGGRCRTCGREFTGPVFCPDFGD